MANHLAMAAIIEPGDEILIEHPAYGPILDVARYLQANVKRFRASRRKRLGCRSGGDSPVRHVQDAAHRDHEPAQSDERAHAGFGSARNWRHRAQRWSARPGG